MDAIVPLFGIREHVLEKQRKVKAFQIEPYQSLRFLFMFAPPFRPFPNRLDEPLIRPRDSSPLPSPGHATAETRVIISHRPTSAE